MEGCCFLCLDINKEYADCIKVNSSQWQEQNIKNMIEKHLWIMESILPSSWLCHTCWEALNGFHKFYIHIEEAHMDFGKLMKKEFSSELEDKKEENTVALNEIFINELEMVDNEPDIKEEQDEDFSEDDVPLIKHKKRKRPTKDASNNKKSKDPLNSGKKYKKSTKSKNLKKQPTEQLTPPTESKIEESQVETIQLKIDPDDLQLSDKSNLSHSDHFDECISDTDYVPKESTKRPKRSKKKQRKRKDNSTDCDDSNTDSDYNPKDDEGEGEENTKISKQQSSKESDAFIAENFKMTCDLCKIPMDDFRSLGKHFKKEHDNQRPYTACCTKKFYNRVYLIEHIKRHLNPCKYKCNVCGKVMSTERSLEFHHDLLHTPEEEKKIKCIECGKNFASERILGYHMKTIHSKEHFKICEICGKSVRRGITFQRHMLDHEGKKLPTVSCEICGLIYGSNLSLKKHMRTQHPEDGNKERICNICLKILGNSSSLKEHIRRVHGKEIYKCTICEREFKLPIRLKEHMATHTGIALYTCPWCPKTFNASGGMHAHRKRQHPVEWEQGQRQKKLERYKDGIELNKSEI